VDRSPGATAIRRSHRNLPRKERLNHIIALLEIVRVSQASRLLVLYHAYYKTGGYIGISGGNLLISC
jgi:hypothetical protein